MSLRTRLDRLEKTCPPSAEEVLAVARPNDHETLMYLSGTWKWEVYDGRPRPAIYKLYINVDPRDL